ncbi:MAG TPA: sialidase family protein [Candidatus Hydrogenedentes bacterium]|nr:sialidase family protein [Candidatus Hydrogenedentota bacterium]
MRRRSFLHTILAGTGLSMMGSADSDPLDTPRTQPLPLLANKAVVIYESPDPTRVYAYSPGIARLPSGRLVATMDQGGPGLEELPGIRMDGKKPWRGQIYTSDDRGRTWSHRSDMPLIHARPVTAGKSVYVIGHRGDLGVMRSDDEGATWSGPHWLTKKQSWHQAPCNVHYTRGRVYLVMERKTDPEFKQWPVSVLAPVVLSADVTADLTQRIAWTFSNELTFNSSP